MDPQQIDVHDTADERLRRDGQRYTANRRALVDAMASADRPVTVVELIDVATGMPQSSAYRNLSVLEDAGVVRRLVTADDTARFELAEDLTGHHHHHFICEACGTVADIDVPTDLEDKGAVVTDLINSLSVVPFKLVDRSSNRPRRKRLGAASRMGFQ